MTQKSMPFTTGMKLALIEFLKKTNSKQSSLAKSIGVSQSIISQWKKGACSVITYENYNKLMIFIKPYLRVSEETLLDEYESKLICFLRDNPIEKKIVEYCLMVGISPIVSLSLNNKQQIEEKKGV